MDKTCTIYESTENGRQPVAIVTLSGQEVSIKVLGGGLSPANILREKHAVGDDQLISLQDDPVAWFNSLPTHYNGAYVQARMD